MYFVRNLLTVHCEGLRKNKLRSNSLSKFLLSKGCPPVFYLAFSSFRANIATRGRYINVSNFISTIIFSCTCIGKNMKVKLFITLACAAMLHDSHAWVREMENPNLYQGDMVLRPDQKEVLKNGGSAFASIIGYRWPNGVVPYVVTNGIGNDGKKAVADAIADYHEFTCLKFVKRTNQREYIKFVGHGGCSSPVGYNNPEFTNNGVNEITLGIGCRSKGTTMHEIGHSIGLYHEQSRPDRDQHVHILTRNVYDQNMVFNFNKLPRNKIDSLGTTYDYASMMHYSRQAFGCDRYGRNCKDTIRTIDGSKQNVIGNRNGFSEGDIAQINKMYNCKKTNGGGATVCTDSNENCGYWAVNGECTINPNYMLINCKRSCRDVLGDKDKNCAYWAGKGECQSNPTYMLVNCKKSCNVC
ncbi:low choriolytic enzyme-like [Hydractinia symbiolongicarpus]|uniref:low choriolytic enzyme-like n=1 Tax=Hydractinia symbiolongicarpus TaxID=13093 RepID=UPI00255015AE|nr:low choriolytic enzyme-like [Hydractinia symbiolongicarpus]